jgi:hypothetical protein
LIRICGRGRKIVLGAKPESRFIDCRIKKKAGAESQANQGD